MRGASIRAAAIAVFYLVPILAIPIAGSDAAAQSEEQPQLSGYTCCNLHYEGDWISDANWSSLPMIPAGTPIRTRGYFRFSISVEIDHPWYTRKMQLGLDYGRKQPLAEWARLIIVPEDPKRKIDAWPAHVREAIRDGKIAPGMTKEQVIVSVGYPPAHETPTLVVSEWKYWHTTHGTYRVVWNSADRVEDLIDGDPFNPSARPAMLAAGHPPTVAPTISPPSRTLEGLPPAGSEWIYRFDDQLYARNSAVISVGVIRSDERQVEERIATVHGATQARAASRVVDARAPRIFEYSMSDAGSLLIELTPYLLALEDKPVELQGVTGYPHGDAFMPGWVYSAHVHGWEEISVPAGTFRALRIEVRGERAKSNVAVQAAVTGRFELMAWYAPAVKRYVMLEHKTWSGAFSTMEQQTGHQVAKLLRFSFP